MGSHLGPMRLRLRLREVNLQKGTSWALSPDLCDPSFASQGHLPAPPIAG